MKSIVLKISVIILIVFYTVMGCEKENPEPFHAKGKIIEVTDGCYGEIVLIEVESPKGIGVAGAFARIGEEEKRITYQNAIAVPYFSKIGVPNTVPQTVGTWLYFEYRELTEEEEKGALFIANPVQGCYGNIIPPYAKKFIITKVIDFK